MQAELNSKAKLYKTAYATVSCAHFKAGDCVSVQYSSTDYKGTKWFLIHKTEHGKLPYPVAYPEHHLNNFCL